MPSAGSDLEHLLPGRHVRGNERGSCLYSRCEHGARRPVVGLTVVVRREVTFYGADVFTRPVDLSDEFIAASLSHWGIQAARVEYRPLGFGSHHWLVEGDARWFLTVDDLMAKRRFGGEELTAVQGRLYAALASAAALRDAGLDFVVAPAPLAGGGLLVTFRDRYAAALYPFLDGESFDYGEYATDAERDAVLALLARLHATPAATVPEIGAETFTLPHSSELIDALATTNTAWDSGPYAERVRALLREQTRPVVALRKALLGMVGDARAERDRFVVTHGEPHRANTMRVDGRVVLIDWDTTLLAPPERDIWMLGITDGPWRQDIIDLYRMHWDLMEVAGYVAFFRGPHGDTRDAQEAWQNLNEYIAVEDRWPALF